MTVATAAKRPVPGAVGFTWLEVIDAPLNNEDVPETKLNRLEVVICAVLEKHKNIGNLILLLENKWKNEGYCTCFIVYLVRHLLSIFLYCQTW